MIATINVLLRSFPNGKVKISRMSYRYGRNTNLKTIHLRVYIYIYIYPYTPPHFLITLLPIVNYCYMKRVQTRIFINVKSK